MSADDIRKHASANTIYMYRVTHEEDERVELGEKAQLEYEHFGMSLHLWWAVKDISASLQKVEAGSVVVKLESAFPEKYVDNALREFLKVVSDKSPTPRLRLKPTRLSEWASAMAF